MKRISVLTGITLALVSFASLAQANTVTGSIWENDSTGANNATIANIPVTTPDVTFSTTSPLNFSAGFGPGGLPYTINEFLTSGAGSTILTGASQLGNTMLNTFFNFQGTVSVTNGQTFTVAHDDGLTLVIDGLHVIDAPGPTSPTTTTVTYTGPTGNFAFDLAYGECCGAPARLAISLPLEAAVPEPSTWAMMILGFMGVGFMAYRRRDKQAGFRFA
jgi:hypothetical protein